VAFTIRAGGRYHGLLNAPAIGISAGISRLATYIPKCVPEFRDLYYVTTVGSVSILDKMRVVKQLQDKGYNVFYSLAVQDKKLGKVITDCCTSYIRYIAIVGEAELASGQFSIKDLKEKTQSVEAIV
jgi:histidyl-tRNA synthetase